MVIHSLLQQMQIDGFGTIGTTLQVGTLAVDANGKARNGVAVALRGSAVDRIQIEIQPVDFYVRDSKSLTAIQTAQEILEYLQESFSEICDLPAMPPLTDTYSNVTIIPTASVEFVGVDDNNGYNYVVSGEIRYKKD